MSNIQYLKIGKKGVIGFDIPVYTIGKGKPELTISCSVHGDETAGLFIVSDFLDNINENEIRGTINIIPSANPVAQFINSRVSFLDLKDLNRLNKGNIKGSYTERCVAALFEFMKNSDVVINIHEFEMRTPVTGIFDNFGSEKIRQKNLEAVKIFNPELIWQINYDADSESQYQSTLDMALTNTDVVNFAFETSQLALITYNEIKKASQGLINIASSLGIIVRDTSEQQNCLRLSRREVNSEFAGIWQPEDNLNLLQEVKKGDKIGTIKTLPEFDKHEIYSDFSGILMQFRHRQVISTGTAIYSIGIKN